MIPFSNTDRVRSDRFRVSKEIIPNYEMTSREHHRHVVITAREFLGGGVSQKHEAE